jgi:zinc transporter 1/2/3
MLPASMSPDILKLMGATLIGAIALTGSYLPSLLRSSQHISRCFPLSNTFAGGVFLAAGLLHMLPHAVETFNHISSDHHGDHVHPYPWAFLLAAFGFLFILFIEKVAVRNRDFDEPLMVDNVHNGCHGIHTHQSAYPAILLIALSAHSLFSGIALGTSTHSSDILAVFIAIAAHKGTEAFALGVTLSGSSYARSTVLRLIVIFALMTPIGVVFGLLFTHTLSSEHRVIAEASFNAIAAGTFIYIASLDILTLEFRHPELRWSKFACTLLGFGAVALLTTLE